MSPTLVVFSEIVALARTTFELFSDGSLSLSVRATVMALSLRGTSIDIFAAARLTERGTAEL